MHLQENTINDLDLQVKVTRNVDLCPLHHVTMHLQSLMLLHQSFRRRGIYNLLFDLDLGVKVTQNVAQYPRHHVTYAPAKFDIATIQG